MLIGREDIIEDIRAQARDPRRSPVIDLRGGLGTGRTAILHDVRTESKPPGIVAAYADLDYYDPGHPGQTGARTSVGAVQASFSTFADLLKHLAAQALPPEVLGVLDRAVHDARHDEVIASRVIDWEEVDRPFAPADLVEAWRRAARSVGAVFLEQWQDCFEQHQQPERSCLLLLDNVDRVAEQEMGDWLRELICPQQQDEQAQDRHGRLGRTVVVLTRADDSDPWRSADGSTHTWPVSNFSPQRVEDYLNKLRRAAVHRTTCDVVYEVSSGHPATLRLVQELLWESSLAAENPVELLRGLPAEREEKVAALVERLVERQSGPTFMRALEAVAVPRWFDAEILRALLLADRPGDSIEAASAPSTRSVLEWLRKLPFVEGTDRRGQWRIHEYVRSSLLVRMTIADPDRLDSLHQRMKTYYENRLTTRIKGPAGQLLTYDDSHRFLEQPDKQLIRREWLHHMAHSTDEASRRKALLEASRLFLDSWWWWGNFVHFDFCDRLVADLGQVVRSLGNPRSGTPAGHAVGVPATGWPQLSALHAAFVDVLEHYPLRSHKWPHADWARVRRAALSIERLCGLTVLPPKASPKQRHVSALVHTLLAHTWRYEDPLRPEAEEMYVQAERLFRSTKESWNEAWIAFELADMHLARVERAADADEPADTASRWQAESWARWQQAADIVQPRSPGEAAAEESGDASGSAGHEDEHEEDALLEAVDHELMSNLHRLRGDWRWREGRSEQAARCYGRAVLHAHLFHLEGNPPDEYTMQLHVDVVTRAINRLMQLWRSGEQEQAVACAQVMWREARRARPQDQPPDAQLLLERLAAADRAGQGVLLARALFPRGPRLEELDKEESPFIEEFQEYRKRLDGGEFHDLHEPL